MKYGVNLKIDVSKIEKGRLFKGAKGTYLDAQVFIDIDNVGEFGDNGMIVQQITKEERENGVKGQILGNATVFWKGQSDNKKNDPSQHASGNRAQKNPTYEPDTQSQQFDNSFDSDLPF